MTPQPPFARPSPWVVALVRDLVAALGAAATSAAATRALHLSFGEVEWLLPLASAALSAWTLRRAARARDGATGRHVTGGTAAGALACAMMVLVMLVAADRTPAFAEVVLACAVGAFVGAVAGFVLGLATAGVAAAFARALDAPAHDALDRALAASALALALPGAACALASPPDHPVRAALGGGVVAVAIALAVASCVRQWGRGAWLARVAAGAAPSWRVEPGATRDVSALVEPDAFDSYDARLVHEVPAGTPFRDVATPSVVAAVPLATAAAVVHARRRAAGAAGAALVAVALAAWCAWAAVEYRGYGNWRAPERPARVPLDGRAVALAASNGGACAALASGRVACWGHDGGRFVDGRGWSRRVPRALPDVRGERSIALGHGHACALDGLGRVLCWGGNRAGQLGDGTAREHRGPVFVAAPGAVTSLSAALATTCAVVRGGAVWCWGDEREPARPRQVPFLTGVAQVAVGLRHACAIDVREEVRCWGANDRGELGDGATRARTVPRTVALPGPARHVAAGSQQTCAALRDGAVWCWGQMAWMAPGAPPEFRATPARIPLDAPATAVAAGDSFGCARLEDGGVACWGDDRLTGRAGAAVARVPGLDRVAEVVAAEAFACARRDDGGVWCWGR